jgi:hypothetical protein
LLRLLQKEYGNEYREGRSAEEAAKAMQDVNPRLAQRTPRAAMVALNLKEQFRAYIDGREPFNRKRSRNESLQEYWSRLLNDNDSDVLAVSQCRPLPYILILTLQLLITTRLWQ